MPKLPEFESAYASSLQDPLELRGAPRVAADLTVSIYTTDLPGPLPARARDLSVGGICVATATPFAIKSTQRVAISLPGRSITVEAQGCWQRDAVGDDVVLSGLSFVTPSREALDVLWDLVFGAGKRLARFLYEKTDLFELGVEEGLGLAQLSRYRDIPAGRFVYRQDTKVVGEDSIFIVMRGSVALQARVRDALEIETERLGPGELFGGLPLLANVSHAESAVATVDTRLLEVDREAFRYLRLAKPWLGYRLAQALLRIAAGRLRALFARLQNEL